MISILIELDLLKNWDYIYIKISVAFYDAHGDTEDLLFKPTLMKIYYKNFTTWKVFYQI